MARWKGKPFGYLDGMTPAEDAPVMDNPGRLFCRACRMRGTLVCDEPGYCGNLEPMKPLPDAPEQPSVCTVPSPPQKPLKLLDDSRGQKKIALEPEVQAEVASHFGRRPHTAAIPEFGGRLLGNRTELKPLPDGVEQSWDWFMENLKPENWPR